MEAGKKSSQTRYEVGDLVTDGENSGVVLSRAADPRDGEAVYLAMGIGGMLLSLYAHNVKDGITRESAPTVDAAGGHPLANGAAVNEPKYWDANYADVTGDDCEAMSGYLDNLARFVQSNAPADSDVARAFGEFATERASQSSISRHTLWKTMNEWRGTSYPQRQKILHGWNPAGHTPRSQDVFVRQVERALVASISGERGVFFSPETVPSSGSIEPVTVQIYEGTTREEAVGALRLILAAVEAAWEQAIALPDSEHMTYPEEEAKMQHDAKTPDEVAAENSADGKRKKPPTATPGSRKLGGKESPKAKAVAA